MPTEPSKKFGPESKPESKSQSKPEPKPEPRTEDGRKTEWPSLKQIISPITAVRLLVFYLLVMGVGATLIIVCNFPTIVEEKVIFSQQGDGRFRIFPFGSLGNADQGLVMLAVAAGIAGSFLHAAQSLSTFVGNKDFKSSWVLWYYLRPLVGGILGMTVYFAFRAGLVSGTNSVNPYGVVALGMLGGWFSKTTTDKLQEVFEILLKTDQDRKRKDKLESHERPVIDRIEPEPVTADVEKLTIRGHHFGANATAEFDGDDVPTEVVSDTQLQVNLKELVSRPSATTISVTVRNTDPDTRPSKPQSVTFE